MIDTTPAGWYNWETKDLEKDTPSLVEIQPLLKQARNNGIISIILELTNMALPGLVWL
ncbi:hypothetical protein GF312_08475 [Candidatus Poribacteria bacterium]|nr:hypothetical protein [Candidatus Poribacteria bacterium]